MGKQRARPAPPPEEGSAFERVSHRRHFDVLGRRLKGTSVNLVQARSEASEKRKRTLLQEYRRHGKAGGFIDRRFGENDAAADADEKALRRMQKLRQMQFGRASRFALGDEDEEEGLTHLGTSLAELEGDDFVPSDEEEDDTLNDLITREYHFGGGLFTQKAGGGGDAGGGDGEDTSEDGEARKKTKKEVMMEIITKSKQLKRERAKEKEEDDEQLDALDQTFKQLADTGALRSSLRTSTGHLKAERPADRRRKARAPEGDDDDDEYDKLANELAKDARASRVADRLKTADERAAEEAAQLAELERKRQKRMRQRGSDDEDSSDDEDGPKGGYAARRLKRQKSEADTERKRAKETGDDLGENFALDNGDEDEEGGSGSDGGSDDSGSDEEGSSDEEGDEEDEEDALRRALKQRMGSIKERGDLTRGLRRLRRLGILKDGGEAGSSTDDDADGDDEEGGSEEGSEEEEGSSGEDEEAEPSGSEGAEEESDEEEEEAPAAPPARAPRRDAGPAAAPTAERPRAAGRAAAASGELPFTFEAPATHAEFARWVTGRSAADLDTVVQRIVACNAIALGPDNRRKLQVFFGVLLVHFDLLAQQAPLPREHLDVLLPHLLALSREVPFFAATAARARLERMQRAASDTASQEAPRWPPPRSLMLMRLFALMFPASDFRHPVLTPMAVLLGQYLSHSEVRGGADAAVGVLVAALAVNLAGASRRFVPEAISFLAALVHAAAAEGAESTAGLPPHLAQQVGGPWLAPAGKPGAAAPLCPLRVLGTPPEDAYFESRELRAAALHTALATLRTAADGVAALPAGDVLLAPVRTAVDRLLQSPAARRLPAETRALAGAVLAAHARAAAAVHLPLQLHTRKREAITTYNPRFEEEGFVKGRDYDIDKTRSETRRLKKEIAREAKGAARELRKDNRFLAEERQRVMEASAAERDGKYRAAMSFLQNLEADFKSGGQGGAMKKKRA